MKVFSDTNDPFSFLSMTNNESIEKRQRVRRRRRERGRQDDDARLMSLSLRSLSVCGYFQLVGLFPGLCPMLVVR